MEIVLCHCAWGIPGVRRLPAHSHGAWARVDKNGRTFVMHARDVRVNPGLHILEYWEDIHIVVDWKEVARGVGRA